MAKLEQYSRKIAHYIYDDMEPDERVQFEAELESNEELALEYRRQLNVVKYMKAKTVVEEQLNNPDMEEADRLVDEFFKEKDAGDSSIEGALVKPSKSRSLKRVLFPLLATAAIFAGIMIVLNATSGDMNERLYQKYYQPMNDGSLTIRGQDEILSEEFDNAMNLYQDGEYEQSESMFSTLVNTYPEHPEFALLEGLSKMGVGEYSQSATIFESFLDRFDTYIPEAQWYLSLCYIKLDRPDEAKKLLSELTSLDGKFGDDSKRMLKKLQ